MGLDNGVKAQWLIGIDEVGRAAGKASLAQPDYIIGIDEVGRGPLAGPITVAAVAAEMRRESRIKNQELLNGIKDSKQLNFDQRHTWSKKIRKNFYYSISSVSPGIIDREGISWAAYVAVARCIQKLKYKFLIPDSCFLILLDGGLRAPDRYANQRTIIRGDEREPIIAAASIVAKVHRDAYMIRLHKKFPGYGFDRHKGYGTLSHREAIRQAGLSEYHRATFCKNITASLASLKPSA